MYYCKRFMQLFIFGFEMYIFDGIEFSSDFQNRMTSKSTCPNEIAMVLETCMGYSLKLRRRIE